LTAEEPVAPEAFLVALEDMVALAVTIALGEAVAVMITLALDAAVLVVAAVVAFELEGTTGTVVLDDAGAAPSSLQFAPISDPWPTWHDPAGGVSLVYAVVGERKPGGLASASDLTCPPTAFAALWTGLLPGSLGNVPRTTSSIWGVMWHC